MAKLLKNNKMRGGNFKMYNYWYKDSSKGKIFEGRLKEIFKGRFTVQAPTDPKNHTFHRAKKLNFNNARQELSGKFLIHDWGIEIADNFLNFEQIQTEIIKAFNDLNITYEHDSNE